VAGGLLHHLFAVRTRVLLDGVAPAAATAYLSGLLIGHEIRGIRGLMKPPPRRVLLVGERGLAALYAAALARLGIAAEQQDAEQASIRGLAALARHARLT
jgi:2-dehydro-3-deoxygalactonokinase